MSIDPKMACRDYCRDGDVRGSLTERYLLLSCDQDESNVEHKPVNSLFVVKIFSLSFLHRVLYPRTAAVPSNSIWLGACANSAYCVACISYLVVSLWFNSYLVVSL
jgi:hypothetical protein